MANGNSDSDRARKTIYVTGFNPRLISKHLLEEIFIQGGPIKDITLFETHAYILFEDEESVPYCLALFNDIELHEQKLRLSPRSKSNETFNYLNHLRLVREKMMSQYRKLPPPDLPPRIMPQKKSKIKKTMSEKRISNNVMSNHKFAGIPIGSSKKRSSKKLKKSKRSKYRQKIKVKD